MTYEKFDLEALFSQLTESTQTKEVNQETYLYLLLLWSYFEISMPETGNNTSKTTLMMPNIIQIDHAYPIFDYGSYLKASAGKYYGSATTGRLLITVREMIRLLSERGAKKLEYDGPTAAKRFAWLECEKYNIKSTNFIPDNQTLLLRNRLSRLDNFRPQF